MKLVELLAKELNEWPEGVVRAWQSGFDNEIYFDGANSEMFYTTQHADDSGYSGSRITRKQWKAEREKMNKPKWIRHRGGWMPVGGATIVEVRLRCGDIQKHEACEFLWRHKDCDSAANIMAYRVIEETKDQEIEEVETIDTAKAPTIEYAFGDKDSDPNDLDWKQLGTLTYKLEIDATDANKEIDSLVAKWGQIESPLKWRDAIIHCQAIIEDCEREIERNVNLLDAEGLMMKKDSKKAMQHYQTAIDMSDWRNWQAGDIFEVVKKTDYFTVGNRYSVKYTDNTDAPITATDDDGDEFCLLMEEIKFIRRP